LVIRVTLKISNRGRWAVLRKHNVQ